MNARGAHRAAVPGPPKKKPAGCRSRAPSHDAPCESEAHPMRFMILIKSSADTEAGVLPSEELLAAMAKYNEQLIKAGVMLDGAGLQPSSKGARVRFSGSERTVIDGPFAEAKELVAGYWMIQTK